VDPQRVGDRWAAAAAATAGAGGSEGGAAAPAQQWGATANTTRAPTHARTARALGYSGGWEEEEGSVRASPGWEYTWPRSDLGAGQWPCGGGVVALCGLLAAGPGIATEGDMASHRRRAWLMSVAAAAAARERPDGAMGSPDGLSVAGSPCPSAHPDSATFGAGGGAGGAGDAAGGAASGAGAGSGVGAAAGADVGAAAGADVGAAA
jgi:hypothetical protein